MASQVTDQHGVIPYEVDLFLRICSMFPSAKKEHFKIPIEDLVIYVRCLKLFEDVHDMFAARDRVHSLIHFIDHNHPYKIKKIDYDNQYVKMEVSARDLASIASRYLLVFSHETIMENWPNKIKRFEDCYGLSIVFKQKREYHVNLGHPRLLRLQYGEDSKSLPIDFFERMKEIRVLSLDVPSLPQSLNVLQNLRVLRLKLLKLDNLSAIGGLISLEFLSISTMSLTVVPQEIGELGNLRLLDLSKMNLVYIPQGVLPRMLKLEELYLPFRFRRWGCRVKEEHDDYDELKSREDDDCDDEERINASLSDIGSLSLNALQISVPSISNFPKNSPVLKNLQRFKILVQDDLKYLSTNKGSTNELQLRGDICDIEESGICRLISTTEDLSLTRIRNLKSINHVIYQSEDNDLLHIRLKKMIISECDELEYILYGSQNCYPVFSLFWRLKSLHLSMLSNLREILNGRICFTNLRQINIRFCHKLKYVFPTSMVNELRTLRSIEILDCTGMLGIFRNEVDENTHGVHCIEELLLHSLPNFIGFLVLKDDTIDAANQSLITNEVSPIEVKDVISRMEMCSAFSSESSLRLNSLKRLKIAFCDALQVIFSVKKEHMWISRLHNSLKELELCGLRNLMHIWFKVPPEIPAFVNLQLLVVSECHNLYLLPPKIAKHLVQLQKIQISRCEKMKEIVVKEDQGEVVAITNEIVFPQLKFLELQHMPNLRIFYGGSTAIELPLLEFLNLNQCSKMESFCYGSLSTPILETIQMNRRSYSVVGALNATMARLKVEKF